MERESALDKRERQDREKDEARRSRQVRLGHVEEEKKKSKPKGEAKSEVKSEDKTE